MNDTVPPAFYDRADELIEVANQQCQQADRGMVSSSFLFAASRFNCWVSASNTKSVEEFQQNREQIVEYFTRQYRAMLEDHLNDYSENYQAYLNRQS